MAEPKFKIDEHHASVVALLPHGGQVYGKSIEAFLLLAILRKLEEGDNHG